MKNNLWSHNYSSNDAEKNARNWSVLRKWTWRFVRVRVGPAQPGADREGGLSLPFFPWLERPQQCFLHPFLCPEQCKGTKSHEQIHGYPCLAFRRWHLACLSHGNNHLKCIQPLGCPSLNGSSGGSGIQAKKVKNLARHGLIFMPTMTVAVYLLNKCLIYTATGWVHSQKQTTGNLSDSQEGRIVNMGLHYSKKKYWKKKKGCESSGRKVDATKKTTNGCFLRRDIS